MMTVLNNILSSVVILLGRKHAKLSTPLFQNSNMIENLGHQSLSEANHILNSQNSVTLAQDRSNLFFFPFWWGSGQGRGRFN